MGTVESIQAWLNSGEESLLWLMLGIVALSYLLEDLAIVTAAGLATQELMLPQYALLAQDAANVQKPAEAKSQSSRRHQFISEKFSGCQE